MKKKVAKFFRYIRPDIFLLIIAVSMMLFAHRELIKGSPFQHNITDVSDNWRLTLDNNRFRKITTNVPYKYGNMDVIVLERKLSSCMINKGNLIFYTKDMGVAVFFDNYEIYRFGNESHVFNTTNYYGKKWNVIEIPEYAKPGEKIKLVLTPNQPLGRAALPRMYSADDYDFAGYLLGKNQLSLLYSFGVFIFSLIAIGYYLVNTRKAQISSRILWIGIFAMLSFGWFFFRNIWIQFAVQEEEIIKMISFASGCLMFMPVLWIVYIIPDFRFKRSILCMMMVLSVYAIVRFILYLTIGYDVYRHTDLESIARLIGGIIFIILLVVDYYRGRNSSVGKLIPPTLVMFAFFALDFYLDYLDYERFSAALIELGMAISLSMVTIEAVKEIRLAQSLSIWVEHYKLIAGLDILTGLENQSAFLQYISNAQDYEDWSVIVIDVNNLKVVNDQCGHAVGDQLLITLADIIREVFGEDFRKFRLGGDEFTLLGKGKSEIELNHLILDMESKIHRHNSKNECQLEVASGVAVYDRELDTKLIDLLKRADENMYLRKITMKIG